MSILFWLLPLLARGLIGGYFMVNAYQGLMRHKTTNFENDCKMRLYVLSALQLILGLMIFLGLFLGLASFILIPINIVMTRMYHPYWKFDGEFKTLHQACYQLRMILGTSALLLVLNPMFFNSILIFIRRNYLFE